MTVHARNKHTMKEESTTSKSYISLSESLDEVKLSSESIASSTGKRRIAAMPVNYT